MHTKGQTSQKQLRTGHWGYVHQTGDVLGGDRTLIPQQIMSTIQGHLTVGILKITAVGQIQKLEMLSAITQHCWRQDEPRGSWKKKRKTKQRSARGFKNARAHTLGAREWRARIWISELERRCVENQMGHPGEELPERAFCREEALHRAAGHQRGSLQKAALLQKRSSQTQLAEKQEKCEKEQLGSKKERSGLEEIRECKRSKRMRNSGRTRETATAEQPLKDYSPHINISPSYPSAIRDRTI